MDASLRAIRLFQYFMGGTRLAETSLRQVTAFKAAFEEGAFLRGEREEDRKMRSSSTIVHCFGNLEAFFSWLRDRPGYRKIPADTPSHFRPSRHQMKIAAASTEKHVPSHADLVAIIEAMPDGNWRERRDRALVAFLCLSGMRDGAVIGLRLKHVDVVKREILQDPRESSRRSACCCERD